MFVTAESLPLVAVAVPLIRLALAAFYAAKAILRAPPERPSHPTQPGRAASDTHKRGAAHAARASHD
jgi:hypothetical protein